MRKLVTIAPALVLLIVSAAMMLMVPGLMDRYAFAQQKARITLARDVLADDDILRRMDRSISAVADSIEPTVVHIETQPEKDMTGSYSSGAGWIFDTQGYVITNAHVVKNSHRVSVEFYSGRVVEGAVVGTDIYTDIAVVKVDSALTTFPAMRAAQRLPRVGERVFAFGSPFGFKFSMSEGIVSGLGRQAQGARIIGGYTNYIQTDAAVNPGNSGGPLVNTDGHVIGMNVAIATAANTVGSNPEDSGGDSAGISFAIPLGTIEPIVKQIIEHGSVSRGYMGISYNSSKAGRIGVETASGEVVYGIQITGIEPGGPSDQAGILSTDVILKVQGSPVTNAEALSSLISSQRAGDSILLDIYRGDEFLEVPVVLGKMQPAVLAQRLSQPIQLQIGAVIGYMDGQVVVLQLWKGLPGAIAGMQTVDVITHINGARFADRDQFFVMLADEGLLTGEIVELGLRGVDGKSRIIRLRIR